MKKILKKMSGVVLAFVMVISNIVMPVSATENVVPENMPQDAIDRLASIDTGTASIPDYEELAPVVDLGEEEYNNIERSYTGGVLTVDGGNETSQQSPGMSRAAVSDNTDPNGAYIVSNDTVTQGAVETDYEFRWYAFVLNQQSNITINLQMVPELDADLYLFQLDSQTYDLNLIGGSTEAGGGISEKYRGVLDAGTYFFAVSGYSGTGNFAFAYYESTLDVAYEVNDTMATAVNVELSANIVGIIDNASDLDYYTFMVTEPTILRYTISDTNGYQLAYMGSIDFAASPTVVDGTLIKVEPGTYCFAVYSPTGTYSSNSTYTVNFNKVGECADFDLVPFLSYSESEGIVLQTNISGTEYYVNGNPIDISYSYSYSRYDTWGSQNYNISLEDNASVELLIWNENWGGPYICAYFGSTNPAKIVPNKPLLCLTFIGEDFYNINCFCSGAYQSNTLHVSPLYVEVLIDPEDGKLVDIAEFNYFYEHAAGTHEIYAGYQEPLTFTYNMFDYVEN